ncbi:WD40 repeat domain-containing protein [Roseovarius sp. MBR-154]
MRKFLHAEFRAAFRLKRVGLDGNCNPGEFVSISNSKRVLLIPYIEIRIGDQPDDIKEQLESVFLRHFKKGLEYKTDSTRFAGATFPHELYEFTVDFLSRYGNEGFADRYAQKTKEVIKSIAEADASKPEPIVSDVELRSEPQGTNAVSKRPLVKVSIGAVALLSSAVTLTWLFLRSADVNESSRPEPSVARVPEPEGENRAPRSEPRVSQVSPVISSAPVSAEPVHLPTGKYPPDAVAFSNDGKYVAIADSDWIVRVYFADSGILVATLAGHEGRVHSLDFARDSDLLASGSSDHTARIWSIGQQKQIRIFGDSISSARNELTGTNVSFSPDGNLVAYGGADKKVYVRRVGDGVLEKSYTTDPSVSDGDLLPYYQAQRDEACPGVSMAISPECSTANQLLREQTARARELEKARKRRSRGNEGVQVLSFSDDGNTIATISETADGDLQIFDWRKETFVNRLSMFTNFSITPRQIAFNPSDASLYIVGKKEIGSPIPKAFAHFMMLETAYSSTPETIFQAPYPTVGEVTRLDFSPDGRLAIFSVKDGFVAFDVDARIPARTYVSNCYHRHVALSGGSPLMLSADLCDGKGITVLPFTALQ